MHKKSEHKHLHTQRNSYYPNAQAQLFRNEDQHQYFALHLATEG